MQSYSIMWMLNERASNAKLIRPFEKALRLVCKDSELKLDKLKGKYMTIHQHNLQLLMVEIFKTKYNLNRTFIKDIFSERDVHYNLRSKNHLQLRNLKTAEHVIENIQYIGHHLLASLPEKIKDSGTRTNFKQKIKSWKGSTCICRLYKIFISGVGFL